MREENKHELLRNERNGMARRAGSSGVDGGPSRGVGRGGGVILHHQQKKFQKSLDKQSEP